MRHGNFEVATSAWRNAVDKTLHQERAQGLERSSGESRGVSSLKLGLFLLPLSIVVVLIGLIIGNVVIAVVGIALAVGDLLLCATGFLTARRSHRRGA